MFDLVAVCIILYNICIVNNEGIEEYWIIEVKSKLARKVSEGEVRENDELQGERAGFAEVRRNILTREDVSIADKENDAETNYFCCEELRRLMTFCEKLQ